MLLRSSLKTPIGVIYFITDEHVLLGAGFASFEDLISRMDKDESKRAFAGVKTIPVISDLISDYFDGQLRAFDSMMVRQPGEAFSQAVWKAMRRITPGKTISYATLAKQAGSPQAVRAAGTACARNLIAPIVPCHRIIKTGGALGNYGYGLPIKEWLLRHEGALGGAQ